MQALQQLSDKSLPEWTPFAFSLAARLQEEHRSNRLTPGDALWQIAVEQLLLPAVDSDHVVRHFPRSLLAYNAAVESFLPVIIQMSSSNLCRCLHRNRCTCRVLENTLCAYVSNDQPNRSHIKLPGPR